MYLAFNLRIGNDYAPAQTARMSSMRERVGELTVNFGNVQLKMIGRMQSRPKGSILAACCIWREE